MTEAAPEPAIWAITDHICGQCLGRVLAYGASRSSMVYRCAECGETGAGRQGVDHPPICVCASGVGGRNAGIRCVRNPARSADRPWEIIAREIRAGNDLTGGGHQGGRSM